MRTVRVQTRSVHDHFEETFELNICILTSKIFYKHIELDRLAERETQYVYTRAALELVRFANNRKHFFLRPQIIYHLNIHKRMSPDAEIFHFFQSSQAKSMLKICGLIVISGTCVN